MLALYLVLVLQMELVLFFHLEIVNKGPLLAILVYGLHIGKDFLYTNYTI